MLIALGAVLAFALSVLLTGWFRRFALRGGVVDVPNERSSHVEPTPRGGGIAIALAVLLMLPLLGVFHALDWTLVNGVMAAGVLAVGIGFADDIASVPLLVRLLFQFIAAIVIVRVVGTEAVSQSVPFLAPFSAAVVALTVVYLVWMLNLTNFMDGIDGIASVETISVCVGTAICLYVAPQFMSSGGTDALEVGAAILRRDGAIAFALILAGATGGFLYWNWAPARIFLGDSGSGFLGILLGALTLVAGLVWAPLMWSCTILAGVFVIDATTTLIRRGARGEVIYHAHCTHAFQHAAKRWGHSAVTLSVLAINVGWLLPWALLVATETMNGPVALACAYIPVFALALRLRAGMPGDLTADPIITSLPPESQPRTQGVARSVPPLP